MQARAFMHATLDEKPIGPRSLGLIGMRLQPLEDFVQRMRHRVNGGEGACQQIEADLLQQHVAAQLQLGLVAQQLHQHVALQIALRYPACVEFADQGAAPLGGRREVVAIELVDRRLDLGADGGFVADGLAERCGFPECPQNAQQLRGFLRRPPRAVDAGEVGRQIHHGAKAEFHGVGFPAARYGAKVSFSVFGKTSVSYQRK